MTASWDERPEPPPTGVAQTAAHSVVPSVPSGDETSGSASSRMLVGLVGQFDLHDLIIVTIGFSIGFALVAALPKWWVGLALALITLPAVGRVIYVRRRLARRGELITWKSGATAYAGTVLVMIVAVVVATWIGVLLSIVGMVVVGIAVYLVTVVITLPDDLARATIMALSTVIGVCAGVAVLIAVPRYFWRRWDRQLAERENDDAETPPPADESITAESTPAEPNAVVQVASSPQPPRRKQRLRDVNPRGF